jgi:outer membrane protein OmpA-like peptidoglycan-associated protein
MRNRRVEFFFFDQAVGVTPMPAGNASAVGSTDYPAWLAKAEVEDLTTEAGLKRVTFLEMHDTLFRNDSAVVNPEGEVPSEVPGEHASLTTVGLIATILRYNEEHDGKKLFVAGHTDRAGGEADNVKLSNHRARAVLALIEGKKDEFVVACIAKHSELDVTQLMDWTNKAYGFTCKPTVLDRPPSDENYNRFRKSYNEWCKGPIDTANGEIGPRGTSISGTGRLNPPDIWNAMFDLYEHNLRQELGEDENGVKDLRKLIKWVDDGNKTIGYGETHPTIPGTADKTRRDTDRRVEVMFFEEDDKPDLAATQGEEIYDGSTYEAVPVQYDPPPPGKRRFFVHLLDALGIEVTPQGGGIPYRLSIGGVAQPPALSGDAWVECLLDKGVCQELKVEWGEFVPSTGAYAYQRSIMVDCQVGADREVTHARLANLGYRFNIGSDQQFEAAVIRFQGDYGIDSESGLVGGTLPPKTRSKLEECFQSAFDAPLPSGGSSAADAIAELPLTPCGPDGGLA